MTARRVLVIDDEVEFGKFVGNVARGLGLEVELTHHANQFMAAVPRFKPHVIVMDMVMPGVDGIELIRWLSQERYQARVVAVTGYNPDYAKMAALMARAEGVLEVTTLSKPVPIVRLREALLPAAEGG